VVNSFSNYHVQSYTFHKLYFALIQGQIQSRIGNEKLAVARMFAQYLTVIGSSTSGCCENIFPSPSPSHVTNISHATFPKPYITFWCDFRNRGSVPRNYRSRSSSFLQVTFKMTKNSRFFSSPFLLLTYRNHIYIRF
jgi:hypothetical protein